MDYLSVRETYKVAHHRWLALNKQLLELFNVDDDATLELAMLKARTKRLHLEKIAEYAKLSLEYDKAADQWDSAQLLQQANKQLNRDLSLLEC